MKAVILQLLSMKVKIIFFFFKLRQGNLGKSGYRLHLHILAVAPPHTHAPVTDWLDSKISGAEILINSPVVCVWKSVI